MFPQLHRAFTVDRSLCFLLVLLFFKIYPDINSMISLNDTQFSSAIFECFTIVRILYGKSTQYTSEILNYNTVGFYFANFLT